MYKRQAPKIAVEEPYTPKPPPNSFAHKLNKGEFVIAVELNPPFSTDLDKVLEGAGELKDRGVDILTVADSPMARSRIDSGMVAAKIKREAGIETMPHLCCRDRNVIAIKSWLLGTYIEGIRNLLVITGDPVPSPERNDIKKMCIRDSHTHASANRQDKIPIDGTAVSYTHLIYQK